MRRSWRVVPILLVSCLSVPLWAFQARPGYFSTIAGTSTAATALLLAGGVTAGSGAVPIIGTTGKIPALTATYFTSVDASTLTGLNATQLTSGTVPDARFPATLPVASGVNLTNLNATNIASGTLTAARLPAVVVASTSANTTAGTVSAADSAATTLFNSAAAPGLYVIAAWITDAGAIYTASADLICDNTNCRILSNNGAGMTLTLSTASVQATQTTGTTQTITWTYLRVR